MRNLGQVLAHDEDADAEEQGKGDHQQGQGGEEVYGLGLGGSLGRVGLGLGPILDGRFGGGVQAGILVARVGGELSAA